MVTYSQAKALRAGFLILIGFAILRPLSLMAYDVRITGSNVLELVGIGISYLLLIPSIITLRQLRINPTVLFSLVFCSYSFASLCWGSEIRVIAQLTLPFLLFFSSSMFMNNSNQLKPLFTALLFGFLIPISVSACYIVLGLSLEMVEFWNQLPRYKGAFSGSHNLAYTMLFFSFIFGCYNYIVPSKSPFTRYFVLVFLLLSIYCLYKSHTRTAIIGFSIFWSVYIFGKAKKLAIIVLVVSVFMCSIFYSQVHSLLWKKDGYDLDVATSGRITMWKDNVDLFIDSSLPQKLLGRGLVTDPVLSYHNDYIRLLMNLGVLGLLLYFSILISLLWDIFHSNDKKRKCLFGGILLSVAIMNFGSNAVVFRIELSQYFWLIMSLFYFLESCRSECQDR